MLIYLLRFPTPDVRFLNSEFRMLMSEDLNLNSACEILAPGLGNLDLQVRLLKSEFVIGGS